MSAVVSNKIYFKGSEEELSRIKESLTYVLWRRTNTGVSPITKYDFINVNKEIIAFPAGRKDLLPSDCPLKDKTQLVPIKFPEFKATLRPDQQEVYDKVNDSCLINALPGWGKTFTAIAIAVKLGQKTLIIVHTKFLLDQWIIEIEKTLGIKPGVISAGKLTNMDSPIVVGNIQSLTKFQTKIAKEFGTLILDECHHCPSTTFSKLVDASHARYKIGLSGTLKRKDGEHVFIPNYFSTKVITPAKNNVMEPIVYRMHIPVKLSDDVFAPWVTKVNTIYNDKRFQQSVVDAIDFAFRLGHKVLVVSDRVELLEFLHSLFEEDSVLIIGTTSNRDDLVDKIKSGEKGIIFGTVGIFKEGISINELSCLIPTILTNNAPMLEQLIGRVIRLNEGKLQPLVFDFMLDGRTARRQARDRTVFYEDKDYQVVFMGDEPL